MVKTIMDQLHMEVIKAPQVQVFARGLGLEAMGLMGNTGSNGKDARIGNYGLANLPANIVIKSIANESAGSLVVFTTSGTGGTGGNGANGNPIIISFPKEHKSLIQPVTKTALFWSRGDGGHGGNKGIGSHAATDGSNGGAGKFGIVGKDGSHTGAPGNIIFNWI
ncbi:hypothetical protein [Isorropodon fossajaponicum symbiont]|uniref:hypothetical protein n=1 Tax=Isorropodon fossajaponicum symbiont TaxID=883811 RepID=UPI001CECBEE7|nr:hypothetical protein [Isorropodon fossajaponicum symbiont]